MNFRAFMNTISTRSFTLPIVILYVTEGCNLQCITCSYRNPMPNELTVDEIRSLANDLHRFGLKHIVYSGGEPLLRRDFREICDIFSSLDVKQTLLTNGFLLQKRAAEFQKCFDEIIVSIDGPVAEVHNKIRGVQSFDLIVSGIKHLLEGNNQTVSLRTVLQKGNFRFLDDMISFAVGLGVYRISFLAADVLSDSFGRDTRGTVAPSSSISLNQSEATEFRRLVTDVIAKHEKEFDNGFISDSPERLFHIVQYYEALADMGTFPRNYCNAPMVSAVITSTGDVQPCFFLPSHANIRNTKLEEWANNQDIQTARKQVGRYALERCKTCVCTLNLQPLSALISPL